MMKNTCEPIRIVASVSAWLAVLLLVISTFFQGLAIYAMTNGAPDILEENPWLLPCWIAALVLLPVAAILNKVFKNKENWPISAFALALVGAVLALIVALALKDALPLKAGSNVSINGEQGLDTWKLIYRHLSSVFAGGLVMLASALNHIACRDDRIRMENEQYENHFDLSGDPLFSDRSESTIGLDTYAEGTQPNGRKLKKSQRVAKRKAEKS